MREGPRKDGQSLEDEEAQHCPICLNRPRRADRAMPDCCTHVYCSACILRWAQMVQSCPVDRRPFSVIYLQGCIKLPVKVSGHTCSGQDARRMCRVCVDETEETTRMQEKRVNAKQKLHSRKCDSNKLVHKNRKMSGDSCHALLRSQHVYSSLPSQQGASVGTVTRIITESVEVCEELQDDVHWRRLERRPRWLPAPAISTGVPRVSLHSHLFLSAVSASLNLLLSENTVPYGRVCAVTCPKGEERKGTRGSKSSAKPTEAVPTRRSSRHSRTETEDTTAEPSQATDSGASSSTNHTTTSQTVNDTHASTSRDQQENNQRAKTKGRAKKTTSVERNEEEEKEEEPESHEEEKEEEPESHEEEKEEEPESHEEEQEEPESLEEEQEEEPESLQEEQEEPESHEEEQEEQQEEPESLEEEQEEPESLEEEQEEPESHEEEQEEQQEEPESLEEEQEEPESHEEEQEEPESHEEDAVSKEEESDEPEADKEPNDTQSPAQADNDSEPEQKMEEENDDRSSDENELSPDVNKHEEETTTIDEEVSMDTDEHEDNQTPSQEDMLDIKQIMDKCDENQEESLNVSPVKEDSAPPSCAELECASQNDESPLSVEPIAELSRDTSDNITDTKQESDTTADEDDDLKQESCLEDPIEDQRTHRKDRELPLVIQENATSESLDTNARSPQDNTDLIPMECDSPAPENEANAVAEANANVIRTSCRDPKTESCKDPKDSDKREGRARRSRFHSPTTTWSPSRESRNEESRRSRSRDRSSKTRSTSSCREQQGMRSRSRERSRSKGRSRSRERSRRRRSRSRSRTRNRANRRSPSQERVDQAGHSPHKRESWGGDGWRGRGGGRGFRNSNWRNNSEKPGHFPAREPISSDNGSFNEASPDRGRGENPDRGRGENPDRGRGENPDRGRGENPDRGRGENPDWVKERERPWMDTDTRGREPRREENASDPPADWSRGGWNSDQRSAGRGRGAQWSSGQQGEPADNWRQRNSFSGTANNVDSYNRFNENRAGAKRKELEGSDTAMDRSGWSSASSWAVRRTLPADVQNYYSRRGGGNAWNKQEEEPSAKQGDPPQNQPAAPLLTEAVPQSLPTLMPPQLGMLGVLRYPMPPLVPRAPGLQPAQFGMPPPVPVHLHPAGPLLQVPSIAVQGLPPPPPPPPPVQQGLFTESHTPQQAMPNFSVPVKASFKPMPTRVGATLPPHTGTLSVALPSSTTPQPASHSKESSKKEKKLQIQERAVNEVKAAIKPYYQKNEINKEEYKEIVRKAVEKVCHSKSGEVKADKVANLVRAYVDKYKRLRKSKSEKS